MVLILMFFSCGWKFICGFIDVVFSVFGSEICLLLSLFCSWVIFSKFDLLVICVVIFVKFILC